MNITTLVYLIAMMPSIICAAAAGWMAYNGKPGWGWFIFAAVLLHASIKKA